MDRPVTAAAALPDAGATPKDQPLPSLREDLKILRGGTSYSGAPTWIVQDPLRGKFFRITFEIFQLLSLWNTSRSLQRLGAAVEARFGRTVEPDEVGAVLRLLDARQMLAEPVSGWKALHAAATKRHSRLMSLVHNYLFFKIPLLRPERFLQRTWPYVAFLFTRGFLAVVGIIGLAGLYLVSRQWDAFVGSIPHVFTLEGAATSLLAVVLIKALHELGHAYTAHRYGVRVPTIGAAFMVMMPLLYTDVTEAWRLRSRLQRFRIDVAGVAVELCVAAIALFLWVFVPDGAVRSALFILAATGWVLSLIVNVNPFMRFDGYYMFADLLGVENLQPRAFAHMRWRLRKLVLGVDPGAAESFPARLDAILVAYAVATTIYRVILYVGIALLVYHFAIKLLGVAMFVVEVWFFLLRPVYAELKEWWAMRADILKSRRAGLSAALAATMLLLFLLPLSARVSAPAILQPARFVRLFPAEPGRIESVAVREGEAVRQGDILFTIISPALDQERRVTAIETALAERRLQRIGASAGDLSEKSLNQNRLASLAARAAGVAERSADLVVRAPFDGVMREVNPALAAGRWVSRKEQLGYLAADAEGLSVRGYVAAGDRARLAKGSAGRFVPDDVSRPALAVEVENLGIAGLSDVAIPQLSSKFGGMFAVHELAGGHLTPVDASYDVAARVVGPVAEPTQTASGLLVLEAEPQSYAGKVFRQILRVLVREAGA